MSDSIALFREFSVDSRLSIAHALIAGPDPSVLQFSLSREMASEVGSDPATTTVKATANDLIFCYADNISWIVPCMQIDVALPIWVRVHVKAWEVPLSVTRFFNLSDQPTNRLWHKRD